MGRGGALFWAAGGVIEICLIGILALGDLRGQVPIFLALFGTATAVYLMVVWRSETASLRTVVLFGLLFRATLLPSLPTLSDDLYRYVWDGRVQTAGINPYRYAPASEALAYLRDDETYPRINHPEVSTIYPPLAEALFLGCYALHPGVWTVKIALVGIDLLAAWFLLGLIRVYDQHPGQLLIYLWNPLLVVEVAGNGHMDIMGVATVVMALLYLQIGGYGRAAGALALSFLSKFFAICLIPVFWRWMCARRGNAGGWRVRLQAMVRPGKAWPVLVFPAVVLLGYLPYAGAGAGLFKGLLTYAEHWEFNAPVFGLLKAVLGSGAAARIAVGVLFGSAVLALTLGWMPPIQAAYLLTGLFLWLTPTLHPWYCVWMLPFLVFYRSPAWLTFTGLVVLSYHVLIRYQAEGVWEEAAWVKGVEYGGFVAVWVGTRIWRRIRAG